MGVDLVPFADNWAYLKTELSWLDRLLMLAIARQRKETKAIKKVALTPADNVSSHWWKGIIAVSNPGYDDCRVPAAIPCIKPLGYQQQLESRIQVSAQADVVLALPSLRHYLNLTLFEKNLILMALAPEINRRYGRLYHYLHTGEDNAAASDLPTVDLVLRLLCRNDLERRRARAKLSGAESLIERRILRYVSPRPSTKLSSYLQLNDEWVDYLLSEQPDQHVLFASLATPPEPVLALPAPTAATRAVKIVQPQVPWNRLILPAPLLSQLHRLPQQAAVSLLTRDFTQDLSRDAFSAPVSQVALLIGVAGTGKTMAAGAIATSLRQPLAILDLKQVQAEDFTAVLDSLASDRYPVLLIKSAQVWFGRHAPLPAAQLAQWLQRRLAEPGLTLLSAHYLHTVQARYRQQMNGGVIILPLPRKAARTMLWRQAFAGIVCDEIEWAELGNALKISGGQIQLIAQAAIAIAQSKHATAITLSHIQQALSQRDKTAAKKLEAL